MVKCWKPPRMEIPSPLLTNLSQYCNILLVKKFFSCPVCTFQTLTCGWRFWFLTCHYIKEFSFLVSVTPSSSYGQKFLYLDFGDQNEQMIYSFRNSEWKMFLWSNHATCRSLWHFAVCHTFFRRGYFTHVVSLVAKKRGFEVKYSAAWAQEQGFETEKLLWLSTCYYIHRSKMHFQRMDCSQWRNQIWLYTWKKQ